MGARVYPAPTLSIEPVEPDSSELDAIRDQAPSIVVGLTSPTSTHNFVAVLGAHRPDARPWPVIAVGDRTAELARELGLEVLAVAPRATAEELGPAILRASVAEEILLPGSNLRRAGLAATLREAGRRVTELRVQTTRPLTGIPDRVREPLEAGEVDLLLAYSPSALEFVKALSPADRDLVQGLPTAVMGQTTGERGRELGLRIVVEPEHPHQDELARRVVAWWSVQER
jgi:uroporphyrinogen-III synthase